MGKYAFVKCKMNTDIIRRRHYNTDKTDEKKVELLQKSQKAADAE